MNILNVVEREAFDSPPVFNSFQRKQYFDFPSKLRRFAAGLRSPAEAVFENPEVLDIRRTIPRVLSMSSPA